MQGRGWHRRRWRHVDCGNCSVCRGAIDDAVDRWLPACTPEHPRYAAPLLRPGGGHAGSCASIGSDAGVRSAITSRMSQEEGDQLCRQG